MTPLAAATRHVPTYCYNCVAGPDLLSVKVERGVATEIGPNVDGKGLHPSDGRPCVKAYGLIQKTYHPDRYLTPMRRTNPLKGRHEDPGFVPISWDEALDLHAQQIGAGDAVVAIGRYLARRGGVSGRHGSSSVCRSGVAP